MSKSTTLTFHVQPRARRSEIVGMHDDTIKIRIAAPPVDGAANEELVRTIADLLDIKRSQVALVSGQTSRRKRVRIDGYTTEDVFARLQVG